MKTHKTLFTLFLVVCLILSIGIVAYAATYGFTMSYLPGTSDTVTNMPADDNGTGGQAYAVSFTVPQREGYEFLYWTLDYGVEYRVTYVVNPDPTYGTPEGSEVPTDLTQYAWKESVDIADHLTTTVGYAYKDGEKIPGTWTFTPWDKDDFEITEDTTIAGGWTFTPTTYKVTYVVNSDPTYGTPDDSTVPEDLCKYAWKETVDVADQLTTTVDYAYNEKGEKVKGTWKFETWDKDDFTITADTTITGGWTFTPTTYKVTYVVNSDPTYGTPDDSTVPEDLCKYAWKEMVDVKDQLTTTVDYAYNENGEKVKGTWSFTPWDKADFEIIEDTTITGGWIFEPAPVKTYSYTVHYKLYEGNIATARPVHADTYGTVPALGTTVPIDAIPVKELKAPFKNPKKYEIRPGYQHVDVTITHDNYEITIWYQPINTGR